MKSVLPRVPDVPDVLVSVQWLLTDVLLLDLPSACSSTSVIVIRFHPHPRQPHPHVVEEK